MDLEDHAPECSLLGSGLSLPKPVEVLAHYFADMVTRGSQAWAVITAGGDEEAGGDQENMEDVEVEKNMNVSQFVLILPLHCSLRLLLCAEVDKDCR